MSSETLICWWINPMGDQQTLFPYNLCSMECALESVYRPIHTGGRTNGDTESCKCIKYAPNYTEIRLSKWEYIFSEIPSYGFAFLDKCILWLGWSWCSYNALSSFDFLQLPSPASPIASHSFSITAHTVCAHTHIHTFHCTKYIHSICIAFSVLFVLCNNFEGRIKWNQFNEKMIFRVTFGNGGDLASAFLRVASIQLYAATHADCLRVNYIRVCNGKDAPLVRAWHLGRREYKIGNGRDKMDKDDCGWRTQIPFDFNGNWDAYSCILLRIRIQCAKWISYPPLRLY